MDLMTENLQRKKKQLETEFTTSPEQNSSLVEVALMSLYNLLANRFGPEAKSLRDSGAIVAIGHFGRRLLGIHSPVEILLLLTSGKDHWEEEWRRGVFYPLREAGWEIVTLTGILENIMQKAGEDFSFLQSLVFSRYISGNRNFFETFKNSLNELIEKKRGELLPKLQSLFARRREAFVAEQYWLEPDLFYSPGALQDILEIQLASYVGSKVASLEDALFQGLLLREEVDQLKTSTDFFLRVINLLQKLKGKFVSRINFADQVEVAERLRYEKKGGFLAVETFMRDIYQHLDKNKIATDMFWSRLDELEEARQDVLPLEETSLEIHQGLREGKGKIYVIPSKYHPSARNVLFLFSIASEKQLRLSSQAIQWVTHHFNVLDMASLYDEDVRNTFWDILEKEETSISVVRSLYDLRVLHALIPELHSVHALVQHDAFHVFPVHEHHLLAFQEIKKLLNGVYEDEERELSQIARRIQEPRALLLAALTHDIGKSAGFDHASRGARMVVPIAERLGMNPDDVELLQFLVSNHVLLIDNASLRDLSDEEMLKKCCNIVKTVDRLDQLILLSFAVMRSIGTKGWEKWQDTQVLKLSQRIRIRLEKGEPDQKTVEEKLNHLRSEVFKYLKDFMSKDELEEHFNQLAPRYLLSMSPQTISRHLRMEKEMEGERLSWEVKPREKGAELTIITREVHGFLAKAAGVITLHDLDIREAQIFTKTNGIIVIIFQLLFPVEQEGFDDWETLCSRLLKVAEGKIAIDYRIASKALAEPLHHKGRVFRTSKVLVDNDSSEIYTIVEVYSDDRPGLLYTITRTLLDMQINIFIAKISTRIDQAVDVFYIKTAHGNKMKDPGQIEEIQKALQFWLDQNKF